MNVEGASTEFPIDLRGGGFVFAGKVKLTLVLNFLIAYYVVHKGPQEFGRNSRKFASVSAFRLWHWQESATSKTCYTCSQRWYST